MCLMLAGYLTPPLVTVWQGVGQLPCPPRHCSGLRASKPGNGWIHPRPIPLSPWLSDPTEADPACMQSGAIIPMWPTMLHINEKAHDPITFDVYPAVASAPFEMYAMAVLAALGLRLLADLHAGVVLQAASCSTTVSLHAPSSPAGVLIIPCALTTSACADLSVDGRRWPQP